MKIDFLVQYLYLCDASPDMLFSLQKSTHKSSDVELHILQLISCKCNVLMAAMFGHSKCKSVTQQQIAPQAQISRNIQKPRKGVLHSAYCNVAYLLNVSQPKALLAVHLSLVTFVWTDWRVNAARFLYLESAYTFRSAIWLILLSRT
jgi:hypothetical protein